MRSAFCLLCSSVVMLLLSSCVVDANNRARAADSPIETAQPSAGEQQPNGVTIDGSEQRRAVADHEEESPRPSAPRGQESEAQSSPAREESADEESADEGIGRERRSGRDTIFSSGLDRLATMFRDMGRGFNQALASDSQISSMQQIIIIGGAIAVMLLIAVVFSAILI